MGKTLAQHPAVAPFVEGYVSQSASARFLKEQCKLSRHTSLEPLWRYLLPRLQRGTVEWDGEREVWQFGYLNEETKSVLVLGWPRRSIWFSKKVLAEYAAFKKREQRRKNAPKVERTNLSN